MKGSHGIIPEPYKPPGRHSKYLPATDRKRMTPFPSGHTGADNNPYHAESNEHFGYRLHHAFPWLNACLN